MSPTERDIVQTELCEWLCAQLSAVLRVPPAGIDPDEPMVDYGLDSLTAAAIIEAIERRVGFEVDPNALWDFPTATSFTRFLAVRIAAGE
jgi:acyl carrier protein